jgi:hypothetical protein
VNAELLRIERMTATVLPGAGLTPAAADRVAALHQRTARIELERAWHDQDLPPGLWLLDRVNVRLSLPGTVPDAEFAGRWARTVADAIRGAISRNDAGVVHYPTLLDAVADAVAGEALGRRERAWAWRRLGLIPAAAPAIAALLRIHPELALAALLAAVQLCGVAALDRALGSAGWTSAAEVVWRAAGGAGLPAEGHGAGAAEVGGSGFARALATSRLSPGAATRQAWAVVVAVELDPLLPGRPDSPGRVAGVRHALDEVLGDRNDSRSGTGREPAGAGPAEAAPAQVARAGVARAGVARAEVAPAEVPRAGVAPTDNATVPVPAGGAGVPSAADASEWDAAEQDRERATAAGGRRGAEAGRSEAGKAGWSRKKTGSVAEHIHRLGVPDDEDVAIVHSRPDEATDDGWTAYAGLPFLLATADSAGVPDRLADPTLAGRQPAWCLAAIGRLICAADPDDPGLMALAGSHREAWPVIRTAPPADPGEAEELAAIAADWIQVTAARLEPDLPPTGSAAADLIGRMVRRPGRVLARRGWVEVELSADRVDVSVRRAGLDLDPGWVPWLGVVVGYRYV